MPGTARPAGQNGPLNPWWNALIQSLKDQQRASSGLLAARNQGCVVDGAGNTTEIWGTNLSQIVIAGGVAGPPGSGGTAGVQVSTGLTGSGIAKLSAQATGTITVTKGSTSATLVSTASGAFGGGGQQIGAANVSDPTTGSATPAIKAGTTYTIAGSAVTLSQPAQESGTAIYCVAVTFTKL